MHPILFEAGRIKLYSFGLMLVIGLLAAMILGRKRAEHYGITKDQLVDASFWALILGIIGARLVFIIQDWKYFQANPDKLFSWQFEGITSFGGIIFGFLGLLLWSKIRKVPFIQILDVLGPCFMLAHAIGRIGCLLNGCCYGTHCELPWGIRVRTHPDADFLPGLFHPAQIYDSLFNIVGLILLLRIEKSLKSGQVFGVFLILHGLARFIYEFWRAGSVEEVRQGLASSTRIPGLPITEAHVMAAVLIVIGIAVFTLRRAAAPAYSASVEVQSG